MTDAQATPTPGEAPAQEPEQDSAEPIERKSFLSWLSVGWIAFAAATGGFFTMMGRFMFPNVLFEPPQSFTIGFPDDFQIGVVDERFKDSRGIWVVRSYDGLYALSTVCTHLGCTPNWLITDNKFKCPCHGSGFRKSGINFEGPAPRPLERYKVTLTEDGQVFVDKSVIFQYEKGQWDLPGAILKV